MTLHVEDCSDHIGDQYPGVTSGIQVEDCSKQICDQYPGMTTGVYVEDAVTTLVTNI